MMKRLKGFVSHNKRVLKIATKPTKNDFTSASKITGIGIVVIGALGFLIFLTFNILGLFR